MIVEARNKGNVQGDMKAKPPGVFKSVHTIATQPLDNFSYETVNLIKRTVCGRHD